MGGKDPNATPTPSPPPPLYNRSIAVTPTLEPMTQDYESKLIPPLPIQYPTSMPLHDPLFQSGSQDYEQDNNVASFEPATYSILHEESKSRSGDELCLSKSESCLLDLHKNVQEKEKLIEIEAVETIDLIGFDPRSRPKSSFMNRNCQSSSRQASLEISESVINSHDEPHHQRYREFASILFRLHKQEQAKLTEQNIQLEDRLGKLLTVLKKKPLQSPREGEVLSSPTQEQLNMVISELEQERTRLQERISSLEKWKDSITDQILTKFQSENNTLNIGYTQVIEWIQDQAKQADNSYNPYSLILSLLYNTDTRPKLSETEKKLVYDLCGISDNNAFQALPDLSFLLDNLHEEVIQSTIKSWNQLSISQKDSIYFTRQMSEFMSETLTDYDMLSQDHRELLSIVREAHERMQQLEDAVKKNAEKEDLLLVKEHQDAKEQCVLLEQNVRDLQTECISLKEDLKSVSEELFKERESLEKSAVQCKDLQGTIISLKTQLQDLEQEKNTRLQNATIELNELQTRLDQTTEEKEKLKQACQSLDTKESKWKEEIDSLSLKLDFLEKEHSTCKKQQVKITSLEQQQQELQLKLDYLKNSFVQFAKHKEQQEALLPVMATLLQLSMEEFTPNPAASMSLNTPIDSSTQQKKDNQDASSSETPSVPSSGIVGSFWPLW
jgi:hypothetical protein